jgi:WD40 repeat protein
MALSQTVPFVVFNDAQYIHGFDLATGTDLWTVRATGNPTSLAMNPSGSVVVVGTENGNIERYNDQGEQVWNYSSVNDTTLNAGITALALSKDGGLLAAGSFDGRILLLGAGGNLMGSYQAEDPVRYITASSDGSMVLATDKKSVYAFYTSPSSQSSSPPVSYYQFDPKNLTQGSLNTSSPDITPGQNPALPSGNPDLTPSSVSTTITELPTTYSIIRTPTPSPVSPLAPLLGILGAVFVLLKRR